ncbi:MAG TPA: TonB family protein [Methylobacter sp.]|jgi:protein TonB
MFLFNSHEGGLAGRNLKSSGDEASALMQKKRSLFTALTGEENPRFMGGLLLTLVLLLHIGAVVWLLKEDEQPKTPSLMIMEVSLVSAPTQKAEVTPPAPPKPVPPKPEPPKKQPVKQPVKKKAPVIPKQAELPKPQTIVEEKTAPSNPAPAPSVSAPQPISRPAPAPAAVKSEPRISTGVVPLERVPPKYPARAASRHIEGWVKIEFTITTSGEVENAVVVEAEPPEIFDDAALKAINQWTFKEKTVDGVAVEQRAVQTLQFKLTQ